MSSTAQKYGLNPQAQSLTVFEARGGKGSLYIADTAAHVGDFTNFQVITDAVVAAIGNVDPQGATGVSITAKAGTTIYGRFSSLTLASGSVQAFYT